MTTKNKIKLEFTKTQLSILQNALDILMQDLGHANPDFEESVHATAKEKKYFKDIQKLYDEILNQLSQTPAHKLKKGDIFKMICQQNKNLMKNLEVKK